MLLHESARTRVTRLVFPGRTVIRKEPRGPDAERRLRHEVAMLQRLEVRAPDLPVVSNVTGEFYPSGADKGTMLDLLGRRWTLRIIWELHQGAMTFRGLQDRCEGMSSSVLSQRLHELREAGIVTLRDRAGYRLSGEGEALLDPLWPLNDWAARWGERS